MARTWIQIRVELVSGMGMPVEQPPGRVMAVGPAHTFAAFGHAIDLAFGRWDLGHLHLFELPDGRQVGHPDPDFDDPALLDSAKLKVSREVSPGDRFRYTFDLGDDWLHECRVLDEKADPEDVAGPRQTTPVAIDGWGWIPDQYGRETEEGAE